MRVKCVCVVTVVTACSRCYVVRYAACFVVESKVAHRNRGGACGEASETLLDPNCLIRLCFALQLISS